MRDSTFPFFFLIFILFIYTKIYVLGSTFLAVDDYLRSELYCSCLPVGMEGFRQYLVCITVVDDTGPHVYQVSVIHPYHGDGVSVYSPFAERPHTFSP